MSTKRRRLNPPEASGYHAIDTTDPEAKIGDPISQNGPYESPEEIVCFGEVIDHWISEIHHELTLQNI